MVNTIIQFPFRLLWDLFIIALAVGLEIAWISFIFGSVVGVILLLIFMPDGFILPLFLFKLLVPLRPNV